MSIHHISATIDSVLKMNDHELSDLTSMEPNAARIDLTQRKYKGEKMIGSSSCDNFCPQVGCLGHAD